MPPGGTAGRPTHPRTWVPRAKAVAAMLGAVLVAASGPEPAVLALAAVVVVLAGFASDERVLSAIDRSATARSLRLLLEVAIGLGVVAVTGGTASGFLVYLAATVVATGLGLGRPGGLATGLLAGILATAAGPGFREAFTDPTLPVTIIAVLGVLGLLGGGEGEGRDPEVVTDVLHRRRTNEVLEELAAIATRAPATFDEVVLLDELAREVGVDDPAVAFGRVGDLVVTVTSWDGARTSVQVDPDVLATTDAEAWRAALEEVWDGATDAVVTPGARLGVLTAGTPTRAQHAAVGRADLSLANARLHRRIRDAGADQERRRLAADLHDGLTQSLAHLRFELDVLTDEAPDLDTDAVGRRLDRLVRQVERALGDARDTVTGLRASVAGRGLVGTIRDYVRDVGALAGPGLRFQASTDASVPPEVGQQVLLVVQEAVANALRHAAAEVIAVAVVDGPDGGVDVVVADDGVGFDLERHAHDDGLATMVHRARSAGVELELRARPGRGTKVLVRIPRAIITGRDTLSTPGAEPAEEAAR